MLVCQQCGYGLYRASTWTSKRQLHYYRCIGSDGYRRLKGPVCTNRPIRQDALDEFVWKEIIRLLEDPMLVQEIDRRQQAAQNADPLRKREEALRREQARLEKCSDRLISAYQEGLVTLPQLRHRMPELGSKHRLSNQNYNRSRWLRWIKPSTCNWPRLWQRFDRGCGHG